MSQKYVQPLRIRFSHCDPAGIVYHPHYFTILNNLMEDFWRDVLGYGYEGMTERAFRWWASTWTSVIRAAWATNA